MRHNFFVNFFLCCGYLDRVISKSDNSFLFRAGTLAPQILLCPPAILLETIIGSFELNKFLCELFQEIASISIKKFKRNISILRNWSVGLGKYEVNLESVESSKIVTSKFLLSSTFAATTPAGPLPTMHIFFISNLPSKICLRNFF